MHCMDLAGNPPITRIAKTAPKVAAMMTTVLSLPLDGCCMSSFGDGAAAGAVRVLQA